MIFEKFFWFFEKGAKALENFQRSIKFNVNIKLGNKIFNNTVEQMMVYLRHLIWIINL